MVVQDVIKNKPYLAWYVREPSELSEASVLEHILNYGNWNDIQTFIKLKGIKATKALFEQRANLIKILV
jgi:hypothetical protein